VSGSCGFPLFTLAGREVGFPLSHQPFGLLHLAYPIPSKPLQAHKLVDLPRVELGSEKESPGRQSTNLVLLKSCAGAALYGKIA
jgi:hypothetical protein